MYALDIKISSKGSCNLSKKKKKKKTTGVLVKDFLGDCYLIVV